MEKPKGGWLSIAITHILIMFDKAYTNPEEYSLKFHENNSASNVAEF